MDLTKIIVKESSLPHINDEGIVCFNFDDTNFIYNFPTSFIENRRKQARIHAIGVWKIKQLKQ